MTDSDAKEVDRNKRMKFLEALVGRRNATQVLLFRLLKFARNAGAVLSNPDVNAAFQLIVGATFSLWRAIVLAEEPLEHSSALRDAEKLLDRVVSFNAILFPDEKATKQWMGGYYVTNIQCRLWLLRSFNSPIRDIDALKTLLDKWSPIPKPSETTDFDSGQFFDDSVACLDQIVSRLETLG
jgi:hypothetical protein